MTLLPGATLVIDSTGHQAFGPPMIEQSGPPDQGVNASFTVNAISLISSGDYKLAFGAFTTAAIDGTTGTMTDVANAMNAAAAATIARAYPGDETKVPNDGIPGYARVQFIGLLAAQVVATPTVVDDTTNGGGFYLDVIAAGGPPNPVAQVGTLLYDYQAFVGYQFSGATSDEVTDPDSAHCWHRVWYATELVSANGLATVDVENDQINLSIWSDPTQTSGGTITLRPTIFSIGVSADSVIQLVGLIQLVGVPTSADGLNPGTVWSNGGVLTIV